MQKTNQDDFSKKDTGRYTYSSNETRPTWTSSVADKEDEKESSLRRRTANTVKPFRGTGPNGQLMRDDLKAWSRQLHRTQPKNIFKHTKIPYKTIAVSILFFVMGTYFFYRAFDEWTNGGTDDGTGGVVETRYSSDSPPVESRPAQPYEFMILGFLLFIPGSYHTWIALMACCETPGYTYNDVSQFESDNWHNEDY